MPPVSKTPKSKPNGSVASRRTVGIAVALIAVAVIALVGGSLLLGGGSSKPKASTAADISGIKQQATVLGNPNAKVTMTLYEDLQCPICKEYTDAAFQGIVNRYVKTDKVKLDFHGMDFLGADSKTALRIALAAGKQNKLWDVVGLFYAEQGKENSGWVTDAKVDEILAKVPGLDAAKVKADAQSPEIEEQAAALQTQADASGVSGTPTFFLAIDKAAPYQISVQSFTPDAFAPALDDALSSS